MDHRQVVNLFNAEGVSQFLGNWANQGGIGGSPRARLCFPKIWDAPYSDKGVSQQGAAT